jgi:hypothetical protein
MTPVKENAVVAYFEFEADDDDDDNNIVHTSMKIFNDELQR